MMQIDRDPKSLTALVDTYLALKMEEALKGKAPVSAEDGLQRDFNGEGIH